MTLIARLSVKSVNNGRTYYKPITRQAKGISKYRDSQYSFDNLEGYWEINPDITPVIGHWYTLHLATKPKIGTNTKEGSLYMDVVQIEASDSPTSSVDDTNHDWEDGSLADQIFTGKPETGQMRRDSPERPNAGIAVEGVIQGHLEKMAVDLYVMEGNDSPHVDGTVDYLRIRKIRDDFYHRVKEKPIQHEHYCYEHETLRQKGNTGYGHRIDDGWCIESTGVVLDTKEEE